MGDRALVIFMNGQEISPTCYLHWGGSRMRELLEQTARVMVGREGDCSYACARFLAIACADMPGNLSVGCFNGPESVADATLAGYSHGDAGVFVVNVSTWIAENFNGYGFVLENGPRSQGWDCLNRCVPAPLRA